MQWARTHGFVLFTHDLDFGVLLAMARSSGPSVIQVRTQDVLPEAIEKVILATLEAYSEQLERGAIISVDETTSRVRLLPLRF
jgi:predicted nuclease of predicted toxin-antitoxin system